MGINQKRLIFIFTEMIGLRANLPSSYVEGTCIYFPRSLSFQSVCVNLPHSILSRSLINIIPVTHVRKRKQIIVKMKLQSTSLAQTPSREGLWQYNYIVTYFCKPYMRNPSASDDCCFLSDFSDFSIVLQLVLDGTGPLVATAWRKLTWDCT